MDMLSDGFGDQTVMDDDGAIIADYDKWLHRVANGYLPPWDERHDDLVQEGRIAMWRALPTFDPARGALPSWLTKAAEQRMKHFAFGKGQPTGREATRGSKEVETGPSIDSLVEEGVEALLGTTDALRGVEMAYHHGEIAEALDTLSPAQKKYVLARFWYGLDPTSRAPGMREFVVLIPELKKRYLWTGSSRAVGARDRLADRLAHLAEVR